MALKPPPTDLNLPRADGAFRPGSAPLGMQAGKGVLRSGFRQLATRILSTSTFCPYCEHRNPADSKFCSACGGTLHLPPNVVSCLRCGVVSPVTANVCLWCRGPLPRRKDTDVSSSSPGRRVSRLLLRQPSRVIIGTAVLAVLVLLGYDAYWQRPPVDAPRPPVASSETSSRLAPVVSPQPAETPEAKTDAAAVTRPPTINTGRASERKPARLGECTEAVAALGLCTAKGGRAAGPAIRSLQTSDVGKAAGQEPTDPRNCAEGAAALGLCAPNSTQRRE
jgi:ribosomal protein L40E